MQSKVNASPEDFARDSIELVSKARERGVKLRILGALSCYLRLKDIGGQAVTSYLQAGRLASGETFTDLDLIGYRKQRVEIMKLLEDELGLSPDRRFNAAFGNERLLYYKDGKFSIDVFLDKLNYSHDVDFKGRLELDYPTITVTDFLLEKLQIHQINRKDLIDLVASFLHHHIPTDSSPTPRSIDSSYICSVLSDDWGFWYDASENLKKTIQMCNMLKDEGKLTDAEASKVTSGVNELHGSIENVQKSGKWKVRAKVGTKKPWYRDVEEIVR
jgi:hypothetical protein